MKITDDKALASFFSTASSSVDSALSSNDFPLVTVTLNRAESLPKTDGPFNNIDPYAIVSYGPYVYHTDVYRSAGSDPKFNKTFSCLDVGSHVLTVILYDHDYYRSADDFLGKVDIDLSSPDVIASMGQSVVYRLSKASAKEGFVGNASLTLSVQRSTGPWPTPLLKYVCHRKKMAGFFKAFETGTLKPHKNWEISLLYVHQVFGSDTQGWNQAYDKAQQIFEENSVRSGMLREAISGVQKALYTSNIFDSTRGTLEGGAELLSMLKYGRSRKTNKSRMYTYAIVGQSLFCSPTGKGFFEDFLSKHAVHAEASTSVVYAGEFHISTADDGQYVWVLDNNSGTYSPNPDDLPKLRLLMMCNFPGIKIECLHFEDPALKAYKEKAMG